mmetsp:Transcript_28422/g.68980  ORF Transcript_28422/g.68980 Transcript_28422/m.68980 type:complete len:128 (+) Transcript_28422:117-500(+)
MAEPQPFIIGGFNHLMNPHVTYNSRVSWRQYLNRHGSDGRSQPMLGHLLMERQARLQNLFRGQPPGELDLRVDHPALSKSPIVWTTGRSASSDVFYHCSPMVASLLDASLCAFQATMTRSEEQSQQL